MRPVGVDIIYPRFPSDAFRVDDFVTPPNVRSAGHQADRIPLEWIDLVEEPRPVQAAEGVVYSTAPQYAVALDESVYYLKGPAVEVVFAEAVGYELAASIDLAVPQAGLWWDAVNSRLWFASREIALRSGVVELMKQRDGATQRFLAKCIALDAWIANPDRNAGNALAETTPGTDEVVRFFAIDFEKAQVLRGESRFLVNAMNPRDFRPTGELGELCRGLPFPQPTCDRIKVFSEDAIAGMLERRIWAMNLPTYPNLDSVRHQLANRATNIEKIVREVWYGAAS